MYLLWFQPHCLLHSNEILQQEGNPLIVIWSYLYVEDVVCYLLSLVETNILPITSIFFSVR